DLILYHAPDGTPRSRFRLSPSQAAQDLPLKLGAEDVTLRTYGGEAVAGNVVGPEGGTVTGDQGDRIDLPPGAVADPTAVVLTRKTAAHLGIALPSGVELAGVVDLDLNGKRLLAPAALSLALNPAPAAGQKGLLLHVIELESGKAFRAVAALQATASGWTTTVIDPLDLAWPGVRDEGLYAFVRLTGDFGYLRGTVSDVGGAALSGAIVRSPSAGWVQISNADGTYVLPAPVAAAVVATAENRLTGNLGTAAGEIAAADARVTLNIALQPVGPRVLQTTPADDAVDVAQGIEPTIRFSEPVDPASVEGAIQLLSEGQPVTVDLEVQGTLVRVKPRATLLPLTAHELRITSGVKDLQGISLESPVAVEFTTLRVLLTDDVDLSRVFLVEPDANGDARVLGRPGAVPAGALVFIENRTALVDTPSVAAGQDGGFDVNIEATLAHALILHVLIPGSNEIVAKLTPFRTPDLKGAYVDEKAFTFTTGDNVKVVIPEGAFDGPTIVKLTPKPLTESPRPVPSGFEAVYNFDLDFGGAEARKALQITLPALASTPTAVNGYYLLNRMIEMLGKRYWMMHDLMRLDAATGRLTTELPPEEAAGLAAEPAAVVASLADPFALAQTGGGKTLAPKALVRQYKYYVVGSSFPGQYQVAAAKIDLGFTVFPSFNMNFMVGIWNLGMEGMATALNASIERLLEGDGVLMPTRRNQTQTIVVRNLTTGFRLYQSDFTPPPGDEITFLPPDVYGDKVPPLPSSGDPIRFFLLDFSGAAKQEVGTNITAELADGTITVTGEESSVQGDVEVHLVGLDDDAAATVPTGENGSFTLEAPGQIKKRYLLAIGARIPAGQPLEISFNEALFEGFPGIDVIDSNGRELKPEKTPVGTRATVKVALKTGWRAGQSYTLRLGDDLADASGNAWKQQFDIKFKVAGSTQIGTVTFQAVRDIARLGSWLFVAADAQGFFVMDASNPAEVKNVLPGNLAFPFPLADPVRGVAVDPHGRVLVTGGGVTGFGQLKIFDPLALDIPAITAAPNDVAVRYAAFKGSTIISDKLGGTGTQLPSGTPRRVAVLSNDVIDEWKLGDPVPAGLQVTTSLLPDVNGVPAEDFRVNVSGTDGTPKMPVTLHNLTRGRWHRIDANDQGHYTISVNVQAGDRLQLLRNQDSIAYVATAGVGLEVVDVNAFYNEEHNHIESDIRGTYSGFRENLTLCGEPVADIGTAFQDIDTLFDPENLNPIVVVGLVGQRGFILLRSNPASVGQISLLNEECTEIEGS
ncbi:MAG TPA: Ig-like domain-containing protein, partial [Thermoanaerobaculia bacterium]|nr:Ig-like domain-containing protein [Thermoanaerobaculia bacterium]